MYTFLTLCAVAILDRVVILIEEHSDMTVCIGIYILFSKSILLNLRVNLL